MRNRKSKKPTIESRIATLEAAAISQSGVNLDQAQWNVTHCNQVSGLWSFAQKLDRAAVWAVIGFAVIIVFLTRRVVALENATG